MGYIAQGSLYETFYDTGDFLSSKIGGRKRIIIDEVDNLYESRGGKRQKSRKSNIINSEKLSQ